MGNSSKSSFLHQRDLELRGSPDFPNFPPLYPINYQESCIFLFILQSIHPLQLFEERLIARCNPNIYCSAPFRARFVCTKMLLLWVCTFLEDEMNVLELCHQKKSQFPINVFHLPAQCLAKCKSYCFKSRQC